MNGGTSPDKHATGAERTRERSWRIYALHGLLLFLLLIPIFPGVFLRGEVTGPGEILYLIPPWSEYAPEDVDGSKYRLMTDVVTAFRSYYAITRMALDEGEWPLWNPLQYTGMPLLANYQSAVFYPPRLVHAVLDINAATTVYVLLKLWLCGITAFALGRGLGMSLAVSRFLSIAWMFASYNQIWAQWSLPDVSAWLPVLFLGVEWILQGKYRRGFYTGCLGAVLLLLGGHPETAFGMGLGLGFYFAARIALDRRRGENLWMPMACAGGVWLVALAVTAAQVLPFVEYLRHSATFFDRPGDPEQTWLAPGAWAAFFVPRFFGAFVDGNYWGANNSNINGMLYPGMAVWIGAVLAFACPADREQRNRLLALAAATGACLLLAFNAPGLRWVHDLPVFNAMLAAYHTVFPIFAFPLAAAMGLAAWSASPNRWRPLIIAAAVGGLVAAGVAFLRSFFGGVIRMQDIEGYVDTQLAIALGFALLALAAFAAFRALPRVGMPANRGTTVLCAVVTVILAADLLTANRNLNPTLPSEQLFPDTALTDYLQEREPVPRVATDAAMIASAIFPPYGIEEWLGYDGLYPKRIMRFQTALGRDIWNAMEPACSIGVYLHNPAYPPLFPLDEKPDRFTLETTLDGLEVYRNEAAFPRAFLVYDYDVMPDREDMFPVMADPAFDPASLALLEEPPPMDIGSSGEDRRAGTAEVVERSFNTVRIEADTPGPTLLVLTDAYFPGWRATVNGEPAPVFPSYSVFRSVALEAGQHDVVFHYQPWSLRIGIAISVLAIIGTVIGAWPIHRPRPHHRTG